MKEMIEEKIENYFLEMDLSYKKVETGLWVFYENDIMIVISYEHPLIIFRVKLMSIPKKNKELFFRTLLELNTKLIHGAYGIEEDFIVLVDSLQAENLDFNEFQSSIESIMLAINSDYQELSEFNK